jgi:TonB family protein
MTSPVKLVSTAIFVLMATITSSRYEAGRPAAQFDPPRETTRGAQDAKLEGVPISHENAADAPLMISAASVQLGEPEDVVLSGLRGFEEKVIVNRENPRARKIRFHLQMSNRSGREIGQFIVKVHNAKLFPEHYLLFFSEFYKLKEGYVVLPEANFTFSSNFYLSDKMNNLELKDHATEFRVRIAEVAYMSGDKREWIEGGKYSNLYRYAQNLTRVKDCKEGREYEIVKIDSSPEPPPPAPGQKTEARLVAVSNESACPSAQVPTMFEPMIYDSRELNTIYPMSDSLKPTIILKVQPEYTPLARANKIQGTVILNVIFSNDRDLREIKIVQGLPGGLTEKAIAAARRLGFEPARKNGYSVSVRGNLEYQFSQPD